MTNIRAAVVGLSADIPAGSASVVMATGIVSVALNLARHETLSRIVFAVAVAFWAALVALACWRVAQERERILDEARSPAGLTGVAANVVLGTRVVQLGSRAAAIALLVVAGVMWIAMIAPAVRDVRRPAHGTAFMVVVATEAIAVLAVAVADRTHSLWLVDAALAPAAAGLALYGFVLTRFDLRELATGAGDHWVVGGALAISALAAAQIAQTAAHIHALPGIHAELRDAALGVWAAAAVWLLPLVAAEVWRPRLRYDTRRWSTVFPLGMYAACSLSVGSSSAAPALTGLGRAWVWVAVAGWVAALAGMLAVAVRRRRLIPRTLRAKRRARSSASGQASDG